MDISMDIHGKSVDMDMDGKFHIHGKPALLAMPAGNELYSEQCLRSTIQTR